MEAPYQTEKPFKGKIGPAAGGFFCFACETVDLQINLL
jgi:hypothetical protein